MDKEHILSEIKRTTEENDGRPLGKGRFQKETGIKPWDWCGKYWTGWSEAIAEAGYTNPNKLQSAYSDEFLLGKLVELIQELDCFPTSTELRLKGYQDKQFPTHNTFSRFGRKAGLIEAVLNYCEKNDVSDRVADICREVAIPVKTKKETNAKSAEIERGFVYLMKHKKLGFKLGRSNCAERRNYDLGIKIPGKLELIHKITTDDPPGIEVYWKRRFRDKHTDGEWYDLGKDDIKAFRRRKTM